MLNRGFIPLGEIEPHICSLPIPAELVDYSRVGVHLDRFRGIAALGGFIMDMSRITTIRGPSSSEDVSVSGTDGLSATAALRGSVAKVTPAESAMGDDHIVKSHHGDTYHGVRSLRLELNQDEITQRVIRREKPLRDVTTWTSPVDSAVRHALHTAVWRNMVLTRPTYTEISNSAATLTAGLISQHFEPLTHGIGRGIMAGVLGVMLNESPIRAIKNQGAAPKEAPFSLVPFAHVDRALIATARLLAGRLVKPLQV